MDLKTAVHVVFLECLCVGTMVLSEESDVAARLATCKPGPPENFTCPAGGWLMMKNNHPTCFMHIPDYELKHVNPSGAEMGCSISFNMGHLPQLQTEEEWREPGKALMEKIKFESIWLAVPADHGTYSSWKQPNCLALTQDGYSMDPCKESKRYICEKDIEEAKEKPVVFVWGRGPPLQGAFYEGSELSLGCSVIRAVSKPLHLLITDTRRKKHFYFSKELNWTTEPTPCGIRSTVQMEKPSLGYRIQAINCIAGYVEENPVHYSQVCPMDSKRDCIYAGPYSYRPDPPKPQLSVQSNKAPDIIQASCTYAVAPGTAIRWAATVKGENHFLKPGYPWVNITEQPDGEGRVSNLTLKIQNKDLMAKIILLGCYTGEIYEAHIGCLKEDFWCSTTLVHLNLKPSEDPAVVRPGLFPYVLACFAFLAIAANLIFLYDQTQKRRREVAAEESPQ